MAERVPYTTKADWIYRQLRDAITAGRYSAGHRLRLAELASEFGVSEIPVREALRMLHQDGLIELRSHRGAVVADVRWEEVHDLVSIRMHLEVLAVREATPLHDRTTLAAVDRILERMDRLAERGQHTRFSEANRELHRALWAPCPSERLKQQIEELWDLVWRTRTRSLFYLDDRRMGRSQREHRAIAEAVRRGSPDEAAAAMEEHRARTLESWQQVVEHPPA